MYSDGHIDHYNGENILNKRTFQDGSWIDFTYQNGRLNEKLYYNKAGQLIQRTKYDNSYIKYFYDDDRVIKQQWYSANNTFIKSEEYEYLRITGSQRYEKINVIRINADKTEEYYRVYYTQYRNQSSPEEQLQLTKKVSADGSYYTVDYLMDMTTVSVKNYYDEKGGKALCRELQL